MGGKKVKKRNLIALIVIGILLIALPAVIRPLYSRLAARADMPAASVQTVQAPEPSAPEGTGDPDSGEAAETVPDFTVTAMDGRAVSLSDCFGRPCVVNFWATWCPPCRGELPAFERAWEQYGDRVEFLMVALVDGARETENTVRAFIEENGYRFPVYMDTDGSAAGDYGIYSIPMTVLTDADGRLFGGQIGAMEEAALLSALESLTAEG